MIRRLSELSAMDGGKDSPIIYLKSRFGRGLMIASSLEDKHLFLSTISEIIDEARNGRIFILVNDEDLENGGHLVVPAQMATPVAIEFMVAHGDGVICLALGKERADQLGLASTSIESDAQPETVYANSIKAFDAVSSGISAADKARTISVAIDASLGAGHIVVPGHVIPLIARPGGVLVRAGTIEAAVDVARLAGLNSSGVMCKIVKEGGLATLLEFAQRNGLKVSAIRDLIAHRSLCDRNIERITEVKFTSRFGGEWTAITFRDKTIDVEVLALVKGDIDPSRPILVRVHTFGLFEDLLALKSDRSGPLSVVMNAIAAEGSGIVILLDDHAHLPQVTRLPSNATPSRADRLRDYGVGAQILVDLGVHDISLLTDSEHTFFGLEGYGLTIVEKRALPRNGEDNA